MRANNLFYFLLCATMIFTFSCSKEGPQGPAGEQGEQGVAGPRGATGAKGAKGDKGDRGATGATGPSGPRGLMGNANVKVKVFTVTNADWSDDLYTVPSSASTTDFYTARSHDLIFAAITRNILDHGMVLIYFSPDGFNNDQWEPLPYSKIVAGYSINYVFVTGITSNPNIVRLYFFFQRITDPPPDIESYQIRTFKFKVIVISGQLVERIQRSKINLNDHASVASYLHLASK